MRRYQAGALILGILTFIGISVGARPAGAALYPPADIGYVTPTPLPPSFPENHPKYTPPPPTPTATLMPRETRITGLRRRGQRFSLSCEAHIAVTLAGWYGIAISEEAFQAALPHSDNPEKGFVGDVNGSWGQTPPDDYGVHASPVAALLRTYGVPAQARRGMTWQELRAELAAGRPVGVWVVGHVGNGTPKIYHARDGSLVTVARFEHTVIVVGYTPTEVRILDGAGVYTRSIGDFLRSWSVLGNMAITLEGNSP